jgi:hypothetical protein
MWGMPQVPHFCASPHGNMYALVPPLFTWETTPLSQVGKASRALYETLWPYFIKKLFHKLDKDI